MIDSALVEYLLNKMSSRIIVRIWLSELNAGPGAEGVQLQAFVRDGHEFSYEAIGCVSVATSEQAFRGSLHSVTTSEGLRFRFSDQRLDWPDVLADWARDWPALWATRNELVCVMEPKAHGPAVIAFRGSLATQHLSRFHGMISQLRLDPQLMATPEGRLLDTVHVRLSQLIVSHNQQRQDAIQKLVL